MAVRYWTYVVGYSEGKKHDYLLTDGITAFILFIEERQILRGICKDRLQFHFMKLIRNYTVPAAYEEWKK